MSKQIYLVISQTGTLLSRILKLVTGAEYNHASISLTPDLHTMYSFGRLNPYNPFLGGFVTESPSWGTFKRFSGTRVVVLSIPVSQEQYQALQARIDAMLLEKNCYHYNYLGLGLAALRIPYRQKRCYYCSEFVKEMLVLHQIPGAEELEEIVQPIHFLSLPKARRIYCGPLAQFVPL